MFHILWWDLLLFYQMVCQRFLSFKVGNSESWPSLCSIVCNLQCTFKYLCSYPSCNIVILSSSMYGYSLDVLTCHGILLELYISKIWGWQEQGTSVQNALHVYTTILWHEWRDLFHVVELSHLINTLICTCRMDWFCASKGELLTCPAVRDLGVGFGYGEMSGAVFSCVVELFDVESCLVWLLVLKAGPSV